MNRNRRNIDARKCNAILCIVPFHSLFLTINARVAIVIFGSPLATGNQITFTVSKAIANDWIVLILQFFDSKNPPQYPHVFIDIWIHVI